jgi:hypothetical protein
MGVENKISFRFESLIHIFQQDHFKILTKTYQL